MTFEDYLDRKAKAFEVFKALIATDDGQRYLASEIAASSFAIVDQFEEVADKYRDTNLNPSR